MTFTLKRSPAQADGVFGAFEGEGFKAVCLEHAFAITAEEYAAKVAPGVYKCYRYDSPKHGYDVWVLENVPDFMGEKVTMIEVHIGNFNADSDGCILLGSHRNGSMIMDSKVTFQRFMELTKNEDTITLTILGG